MQYHSVKTSWKRPPSWKATYLIRPCDKIVSDTSNFTRDSIKSVLTDLLLAIILVTLVILVFLHNWRNALIVMIVVPVSLIGSFIGMQLFNFTLNLMSLLGMSVVIGVLVDDAIVVIENVYRHLEMGKKPVKATIDAMNEIGFTVITITIALDCFLPLPLQKPRFDILRQFCESSFSPFFSAFLP